MNEDDIFNQIKDAYLVLIHPVLQDDTSRKEIASMVALAPSAPDEVVASMITGASWRERLLGICMAIAKRPASFIEPMLQSLRDPRGISIVPTCAALAVLGRVLIIRNDEIASVRLLANKGLRCNQSNVCG
jgi:hypothetical protein